MVSRYKARKILHKSPIVSGKMSHAKVAQGWKSFFISEFYSYNIITTKIQMPSII